MDYLEIDNNTFYDNTLNISSSDYTKQNRLGLIDIPYYYYLSSTVEVRNNTLLFVLL